jgi:hypothetical protein
MGQDHHWVFMYTPGLSVSNQKDSPQQETSILSDVPWFTVRNGKENLFGLRELSFFKS